MFARTPYYAWAASSLLLVALGWHFAATLAQNGLLPGPAPTIEALVDEARSGELATHLAATMARTAASFLICLSLGGALGFAMGSLRVVDGVARPLLVAFMNAPALVVIMLLYVWFGLTEAALLLAVGANKIPAMAMTIREGALALDRDYRELAAAYRLPAMTRLRDVILPQLFPYLLAASRSGLSLIWKIVLVAELLGRSNGVGFKLGVAFQMFDAPVLFAYSLAFVACALAIEFVLFARFDQINARWRR